MTRGELAKQEEETKAFEPKARQMVLAHLRLHPEDLFTISDLRKTLYPEWAKMSEAECHSKLVALINALDGLVKLGVAEEIHGGGQTYYGFC